MRCPTSLAGAGQDRVSTVLIPRTISDAQGWCSVMAFIQFNGPGDRFRVSTTVLVATPGSISAMTSGTDDLRNGCCANQRGHQHDTGGCA